MATSRRVRVFIPSRWALGSAERSRLEEALKDLAPEATFEFVQEEDPSRMNNSDGWLETCQGLQADLTFLLGEEPVPLQAIRAGYTHFAQTPDGRLYRIKGLTVDLEPLELT